MTAQLSDAILHIDEPLKNWQRDILEKHMRMQQGVISSGHSYKVPSLMIVEYDPDCNDPVSFINMIERHGYHAERTA